MLADTDLIKFLLASCGSMSVLIIALIKWMLDKQIVRLDRIELSVAKLLAEKADITELHRELGRVEAIGSKAHERVDKLLEKLQKTLNPHIYET